MSLLNRLDEYTLQDIYRYVFEACLSQIIPTEIDEKGNFFWKQNGKLHRDGDLPASIDANGTQGWFQNGELHRDGEGGGE